MSAKKAPTLARSPRWEVLAPSARLATSNRDTLPRPPGTSALSAKNVNIRSGRGNRARHSVDNQAGDWDTSGWCSGRRSVLVILLDDDTVLGDGGQCDVLVGDALDGSRGVVDGLDTHAVLGVLDGGGGDGDGVDDVVVTAADGTDGETVATVAGSAGESDVCSGVDGEAVVLVYDVGAGDDDAG